MGRTCRGICIFSKADRIPNYMKYQVGQKRCTFCGVFLLTDDIRCICCKAVLRTKPRGKRKESFDSPIF